MKNVWHNLWPEFVSHNESMNGKNDIKEIVEFSERAGMKETTVEDVQDFLEGPDEEVGDDELLKIQYPSVFEEHCNLINSQHTSMRKDKLIACLEKATELKQAISEIEDSNRMKTTVCATIDGLMTPYAGELSNYN